MWVQVEWDQTDLLQGIWLGQMDQHSICRKELPMDLLRVWIWMETECLRHLQVIWDQVDHHQVKVDQIHYLVKVDQLADLLQVICHNTILTIHKVSVQVKVDLLQVIWDQDQMDQWDLHKMGWEKCILTWMTLVHIINQVQTDLKDLLREQIWMATEWLRLHHLMIHLTM